MIEYEFRTEDGRIVTKLYEPARAPSIGKWVKVKGERAQRVPSIPQHPIVKETRHVGYTLPRKWQNTWLNKVHDTWDERGRACFSTQAEIDKVQSASVARGTPYKFDPASGVDQSCESSG